jgi:hypothetical protein
LEKSEEDFSKMKLKCDNIVKIEVENFNLQSPRSSLQDTLNSQQEELDKFKHLFLDQELSTIQK